MGDVRSGVHAGFNQPNLETVNAVVTFISDAVISAILLCVLTIRELTLRVPEATRYPQRVGYPPRTIPWCPAFGEPLDEMSFWYLSVDAAGPCITFVVGDG